ncbi:hypothetical protein SAMN06295888_10731 [Desulfonatronum zhilinae]|nr:hypothetical protein SAMN06295888_10731 [Desulfonatronum zhilinae]
MNDHECETCSDKDCAGQSEEEKALLASLARIKNKIVILSGKAAWTRAPWPCVSGQDPPCIRKWSAPETSASPSCAFTRKALRPRLCTT